jgi:multidrug efflux system membrane fusion protein
MRGVVIICLLFSGSLTAKDLESVTDWVQRVELSTLVSGMVSRVNVTAGESVSRGTVLIELDQRLYQSMLAAAESRLELASQEKNEARRELDRALELYDRTLLSDHERKQAEIAAASTDTAYRDAEEKLAKVRLQREYSRISAPFDGIVERIYVQPGQAVINRYQPQPLLSLCETGQMKVVTEVDARLAASLKVGTPAQIGVRGQWIEGEISFLGLRPVTEDAKEAKYALEARFTLPENMLLRTGEKAVLRLQNER